MRHKNRALAVLSAVSIALTLTTGLVWGSRDGAEAPPAPQKMLADVNCMQDWTGVQDQNDRVRRLQLRYCDEALGIR